jgi:peptidyl-dipeptidase A
MPSQNLELIFVSGNMWSQGWENIMDIVQPYENKTSVDVTPVLKEQVFYIRVFCYGC